MRADNSSKKSAAGALQNALTAESKEDKKLPLDVRAVKELIPEVMQSSLSMSDFKVRGTIQNVLPEVSVDLGSREDLYMDQGYKFYETIIDDSNRVYSKYIGFGRVLQVADNSTNIEDDSKLYTIIGSPEAGHTAVSHDQLFDVFVRPSFKLVSIPQNSGYFLELITGEPILEKDASSSINVDLGAYYNLAKYTEISQLFVGVSASLGFPTVKPNVKITGDFTVDPPMTVEANINILKKMWFSRFNGFAELQFGINTFKLSGTLNDNKWEINTGLNYGAALNAGIEFAISPDILLGLEAGYRYVLPATKITLIDTDGSSTDFQKKDNEDFWKASQYDDLKLGGIKFGLKLTYSVPPLF